MRSRFRYSDSATSAKCSRVHTSQSTGKTNRACLQEAIGWLSEKRESGMIKRTIATLAFVCALATAALARAVGPENAKIVVVLYPEANDGSPGNVLADRGIRSTFTGAYQGAVAIHNEYLDVS